MKCEVKGCKHYSGKKYANVRFFVFPKNKVIREKWILACGRIPKKSIRRIYICDSHFTEDDWRLQDKLLDVPINKRRLKSDTLPTKNLPGTEGPSARMERAHERARKRIVEEAIQSSYSAKRQKPQNCEDPIKQEQYEHEQYQRAPFSAHVELQLSEQYNQLQIELNHNTMPVLGTATQTEIDFKCSNQLKIMQLERENRGLKRKNRQLHIEILNHLRVIDDLKKANHLKNFNNLKNVFTDAQLQKLLNPEKQMKWSANDICSAMSLRSKEPRVYKYLYSKKFPLPAPTTLEKWSAKFNTKPGILSTVLHLMEQSPFMGDDRLCTLVYDEIKIRHDNVKTSNLIKSPTKYVQVVLARGLVKQWKYPVFYDYNCQMSAAILNNIIAKLFEKSYVVVSITSNMELGNERLWKELNITKENVWFPHPSNPSNKIFVFADVVQMIKLLRIHFLETGFTLRNAKINADPIKEMLTATSVSDFKIAQKILDIHLNVRRVGQKYATQLFSRSVSNAIRQCISTGKCKSEYALQVADFLKMVNNWFDIFNMPESGENITAFGEQKIIIKNMSDTILNMRVTGEEGLLPFQNGILISNAAFIELYNYITRKYNLNCVFAYRVNQDTIEQLFSTIRGKDDLQSYSSSIEFQNKLKCYILGICYNNEIIDYNHSNNIDEDDLQEQLDCTDFVEETLESLGI